MATLGVDTGGTFTDFLLQDDSGELHLHKVLSTPAAPEKAILQSISDLGVDTHGLRIIHGSTVATNAILEAKGVRTVYITNTGLADVLTIGRQARKALYELTPVKRAPLLPRSHCLEVASRLSAEGEPIERLDDDDLQHLIAQLDTLKPEAVAINLLFSFLDDTEERRIERTIRQHFGDRVFISRSSDVLPEYKEYERGITTTLNAMVGPLMQNYLARLQHSCDGSEISIMQSSAGTTSVAHAGKYPIHLLLSGPAGGLIGAKTVTSEQRLLTFDMGGTSTDVSIIDGDIGSSHQAQIAGYPVAVPMVDMHTIGAGGGSIARVDAAGLLLVGPQSAGADPGPACYGLGGKRATVTDANVVLGRLLPDVFLGGSMQLDKDASAKAVQVIADALGTGLIEAAQGIIDIANDHMVSALRVMSVQRGEDPKRYTLVSFGGAGGLHVCALAESLGMNKALVPVHAGVLSALGMLTAEQSRERSRTVNRLLKDCQPSEIDNIITELASQAISDFQFLDRNSDTEHRTAEPQQYAISTEPSVDVRYAGQSHTLNLPWKNLDELRTYFQQKHHATYGHALDIDIELVNLRVRAVEARDAVELPRWNASEEDAVSSTQVAGFEQPVAVFERSVLQTGRVLQGPALITETSSTTWLAQGWSLTVDEVGNLVLSAAST